MYRGSINDACIQQTGSCIKQFALELSVQFAVPFTSQQSDLTSYLLLFAGTCGRFYSADTKSVAGAAAGIPAS
eukprot:1595803-Pyramimonas_sp.AAC.1